MKYKVSVYPESFKGKDKSVMNASTKKITKLIPKYSCELSVAELADAINNMQVFCPATFKGDHKSQDEMKAIQFFALDFDGGIDIDTAKARAEYYKLPIAIYYETSSSVSWSKFRLIFLCCQEVNDKALAVLVQYCLCTVFPEVDHSSKDFSKLYYPGKNIIFNDVSFSIYDLLISTLIYLQNFDCREDSYFTIQNEFTLCKYNSNDKKRQDMVAFKEINRLYSQIMGRGIIKKYIIKHYVKVEKSSHKGVLSYIDNNNVTETRIEIKAYNKDDYEIEKCNGFINLRKVAGREREYTLTFSNIPDKLRLASSPAIKNNYICYFNNIKLINIFKDGGISTSVLDVKPTIMQLFNTVSSLYTGIKFLAPLRQFPSRFYTITGDVDSVGIYGENAPVLLAKLQNEYSNAEISTPLKVESETEPIFILSNYLDTTTLFIEQVQNWLDYLGIGIVKVEGSNGQISVKFSDHNISDVGFGISQVLPIIVQGLSMQKDQLLLLEQPEIHLHPKMQMRIADFLISLAYSERNLIVETHSDHIINRIVRRVVEYSRTNYDISNLVKILFVYKDSDNSSKICEEIKIDPVKGLVNCPPEFFDQYGNELRNIMSEGFENLKRRGQANE